jgi:guanine nucleotide-binding protein subunit alpha
MLGTQLRQLPLLTIRSVSCKKFDEIKDHINSRIRARGSDCMQKNVLLTFVFALSSRNLIPSRYTFLSSLFPPVLLSTLPCIFFLVLFPFLISFNLFSPCRTSLRRFYLVILVTNAAPGAGEAGKSTILKQMKLIHDNGYSKEEKESFKEIIFSNTIQSMKVILEAMERIEGMPQLLDEKNRILRDAVIDAPAQIEGDQFPLDLASAIKSLWKDPGVLATYERSREYQLNDSAK